MTARHLIFAVMTLVALSACGEKESAKPASGTPAAGAPSPLPPVDSSVQATASAPECPPGAPEMIAQGKKLFGAKGLCFTCHGDGNGTALAPNLTDDKWINITHDYKAIAALIRAGVAHPKEHPAPMPPMGGAQLDPEEVCSLAAYVYSIGK